MLVRLLDEHTNACNAIVSKGATDNASAPKHGLHDASGWSSVTEQLGSASVFSVAKDLTGVWPRPPQATRGQLWATQTRTSPATQVSAPTAPDEGNTAPTSTTHSAGAGEVVTEMVASDSVGNGTGIDMNDRGRRSRSNVDRSGRGETSATAATANRKRSGGSRDCRQGWCQYVLLHM